MKRATFPTIAAGSAILTQRGTIAARPNEGDGSDSVDDSRSTAATPARIPDPSRSTGPRSPSREPSSSYASLGDDARSGASRSVEAREDDGGGNAVDDGGGNAVEERLVSSSGEERRPRRARRGDDDATRREPAKSAETTPFARRRRRRSRRHRRRSLPPACRSSFARRRDNAPAARALIASLPGPSQRRRRRRAEPSPYRPPEATAFPTSASASDSSVPGFEPPARTSTVVNFPSNDASRTRTDSAKKSSRATTARRARAPGDFTRADTRASAPISRARSSFSSLSSSSSRTRTVAFARTRTVAVTFHHSNPAPTSTSAASSSRRRDRNRRRASSAPRTSDVSKRHRERRPAERVGRERERRKCGVRDAQSAVFRLEERGEASIRRPSSGGEEDAPWGRRRGGAIEARRAVRRGASGDGGVSGGATRARWALGRRARDRRGRPRRRRRPSRTPRRRRRGDGGLSNGRARGARPRPSRRESRRVTLAVLAHARAVAFAGSVGGRREVRGFGRPRG